MDDAKRMLTKNAHCLETPLCRRFCRFLSTSDRRFFFLKSVASRSNFDMAAPWSPGPSGRYRIMARPQCRGYYDPAGAPKKSFRDLSTMQKQMTARWVAIYTGPHEVSVALPSAGNIFAYRRAQPQTLQKKKTTPRRLSRGGTACPLRP